MARPKKAPRVRLQITLPVPTAKKLRAFARANDRELSEVVEKAVADYLTIITEVSPTFPKSITRSELGS
jgi:hypothetical protein